MQQKFPNLAFVDIETTGSNIEKDKITEIAIISIIDEKVSIWESLIDPGIYIPKNIQLLTGISNEMVTKKKSFSDLAIEIQSILKDKIFIAHNARFDYGFIRSEFKKLNLNFSPKVLCTVKLSRMLFPKQSRHNLDTLVKINDLLVTKRHRALGDADLIYQFWKKCLKNFGYKKLNSCLNHLINESRLPPNIDKNYIDTIPDSPGVYLFLSDEKIPIYIGKSVSLRSRILNHFQASIKNNKEMKLLMKIKQIECISTKGELGALLLESKLIKERLPLMNVKLRRSKNLFGWRVLNITNNSLEITLVSNDDLKPGKQDDLYGIFHSRREAIKTLKKIASHYNLCEGILGLEKLISNRPCFSYQLNKCKGACIGNEKLINHNLRLKLALMKLKVALWPYKSTIGIDDNGEIHIVDNWCYLGTAKNHHEIDEIINSGKAEFDFDIYKILKKCMYTFQNKKIIEF